MKTKITALVLCLAMLLSAVACTEASDAAADTTAAEADASAQTEAETEDLSYVHAIEKTDFEGKNFTIMYPEWSLYNKYLTTEEYIGETMNDAIYDRTISVEEYAGCNVEWYSPGNIATIEGALGASVLAQDEAFQLALTHCYVGIAGMISNNMLYDWNELPVIDLTKSYWNQYTINNMQILGTLPMMSGDLILADVNSIFFSKNLLEDYHLENPYELVYGGGWTVDKMIEMSSGVSFDLDGDGTMGDNDQYGFVTEYGWQLSSFQAGAGISTLTLNSDDEFELTTSSDKYIGFVEKIAGFLNNTDHVRTWPTTNEYDPNNGGTPPPYFIDGRALFFSVPLSYAEAFRSVEIGFGILPFPKYDAVQDEYCSFNWAGYMCVPKTPGDPEFVGTIAELLQYYNHENVIPAFFDNLLDQKVAMDVESEEMLEIIFSNTVYDIGLMLNSALFWFDTSVKNAENYSSYYESKQKSTLNAMNKIIEEIESNLG